MNYLGIDWGKSKIGFAIGSDEMKIATPFLIFKYKYLTEVNQKIMDLIEEEQVGKIVIGQPVSLAGQTGNKEQFDKFVEDLKKLGPEVIMEDERMSTKLAGILQRGLKNKKGDDDVAAAAILQTYFDRSR